MAIASQTEVKRKRGRVSLSKELIIKTGPGYFYKPTKLDMQRVERLVLLGLTEEAIASYVGTNGIDADTLRSHYGPILKRHRDENLSKIALSIYQQALEPKDGGNKEISWDQRQKMQMFVMKTRAGWKENDTTIINAQNVQIVKRVVGIAEDDV